MASHARQQYFADGETLKKEAREFAMTDELKQKLDSIEWGAQVNVIEDVKVNGVSLEVVDKSVDVLVPLVIDNLYTVDGDNALSAKQGKILYDYIQNLQSRGRYLSNWNTATGLPSTNPSESPYEYRAGDYYVVSVTAATGGTNYRPDGSSYTIGVASTTVETEPVHITDIYLYDGTNWLLLTNSTREIPIDDALSTTSTNPVENRVVTNAINTKQDKLIAGDNISIAQDGKTISADVNTKAFYIKTSTNPSADDMAAAQAAFDWWKDGKNPIVVFGSDGATNFVLQSDSHVSGNKLRFFSAFKPSAVVSAEGVTVLENTYVELEYSGNVVTGIVYGHQNQVKVLDTDTNYTSFGQGAVDYTPKYSGSPTTKRYVDNADTFVGASAPTNKYEGKLWYDTTNDQLKVWDGTSWNVTGKVYTAGTNISIDANNVISADTQFVVVDSLPAVAQADENKVYILGPIGTGADKYEEWIVAEKNVPFTSASPITKYTLSGSGEGGYGAYWNAGASEGVTNVYIGFDNVEYTGDINYADAFDENSSDTTYSLIDNHMPYIPVDEFTSEDVLFEIPVVGSNFNSAYTFSVDIYTSTSPLRLATEPVKEWIKIGETSQDLTSAVWGHITGTLSNQTDLQNALDAKQNKFFTKSATAPSNPSEGDQWYDDTNNVMKFYDGTEWKKIDTDTDVNAQWGNITGTLSNQTDLQTALDNKITKEDWNQIAPSSIGFGLYGEDEHSNNVNMQVSVDDIQIDAMAGMTSEGANLTLRDIGGGNDYNPSLVLNHGTFDEGTSDHRMAEYDTYGIDFRDEFWNGQETITTNKSYTFDETSNGIVRFGDLNSIPDNLKSFYLPSDVTTKESLATAQAAYEYMAVGVPILRMGSMYDTSPGTLTFFPVKKVNPGASGTMIFLSTQLSKANYGGNTMIYQDRVEFTVVDGQVTSITKQFTNANSTLFKFLETNVNYGGTYTPTYAGSPTNKKYVDKWDTAVSATAPTTDLYEGKLWYDKVNDVLKAYDGTNWNVTGKVYTAGTGINITNDVISCTLNPVTVSQTAPSNPSSGDLWFNTTKQTLNLYNGTSWVLVGPEIVPITKAAYDLLSSADKNDGRFYLITDNDGTIYVEWANVQNAPISAGTTAPSSPNEGDIWYDTTNDILKVYDGTNWNGVGQGSGDVVGPNSATDGHVAVFDGATGKIIKDGGALPEESNTKAFYLANTSDLTTAQAIYDWYAAGKNPIVIYQNKAYVQKYSASFPSALSFASAGRYSTSNTTYTSLGEETINILQSGGTVTSVQVGSGVRYFLEAGRRYSTPYEPEYDGSPATKKYVDDNTKAVSGVSTTQPSNPVAGSTYYDTTNNVLMVYDGTSWNAAGKTYTAGNGIDITNDVISADIVAGNGINITGGINCTTESDRRGPSPSGFHVPSITEWKGVETIMTSLSLTTGINWGANLHMPIAGYRDNSNATISSQGSYGQYWSSSPNSAESNRTCYLYLTSSRVSTSYSTYARAYGFSVRCFKDSYVAPDSNWTVVQGTLGSAGIFWNQSEGLISITDGTTGYTIQDKNLGATTVYSDGDTLTEANMGYMYQWGNNYGFPSTGTISNTSSTQVDASGYGPNTVNGYYESNTFITGSNDWSSTQNDDLWGDTSNSTHQECTGVTSTLTISSDTTSGSGAPATTPSYIGQQYVDTTNDMLYVATGTSSSSDWTLVGANTGVEVQVISQSDYDALTEAEKTADVIYLITGGSGGLTVAWTNVTGKPDLIINPSGGTAGQLLAKTANGYEWTNAPDSSNTKTFYISSTSDTTNAQAALDWYLAGKNPIIIYNDKAYVLMNVANGQIAFATVIRKSNSSSYSNIEWNRFVIDYSGTTVSNIGADAAYSRYLDVVGSYSTPFTPTADGHPATKKYVDDNKNNAGEGITIGDITKNGRQGPCPSGFHVPSSTEWGGLNTIMASLSLTTGDGWRINLHMPFAGYRDYSTANISNQGTYGGYWSSSPYGSSYPTYASRLIINSSSVSNMLDRRAFGYSVRCFKDSYVAPDSTWTVIQGALGSAGIFWNQTEGLISITDGSTGYTIMDKNLGATTVYSDGDTLSQANMGNMYQWGNNYGFPSTGSVTTSATQVDASGYGPRTANGYYESDTFITGSGDWSSVQNDDLWGDTTGTFTQKNTVTNTGVLSVNGQTGNVTIESGGMQLAPNSPLTPTYFWYGTQAQYDALSQYYTEEEGDTVYYTI